MLKKVASSEYLETVCEQFLEKLSAAPPATVGKTIGKAAGPALNAVAYGSDALNTFKNAFKELNKPITLPKPGV